MFISLSKIFQITNLTTLNLSENVRELKNRISISLLISRVKIFDAQRVDFRFFREFSTICLKFLALVGPFQIVRFVSNISQITTTTTQNVSENDRDFENNTSLPLRSGFISQYDM